MARAGMHRRNALSFSSVSFRWNMETKGKHLFNFSINILTNEVCELPKKGVVCNWRVVEYIAIVRRVGLCDIRCNEKRKQRPCVWMGCVLEAYVT